MTIITKPISEKKGSKLQEPLVDSKPPGLVKIDVDVDHGEDHAYVMFPSRAQRISTATTVCLFLTALLVMSIGIIGGVYLYRQFARSQMHRFTGWCNIPYNEIPKSKYIGDNYPTQHADSLMADLPDLEKLIKSVVEDNEKAGSDFFKEEFELDIESDSYEKINVPDFKGGRRGRFIHDFMSNKTGIVDLEGQNCFVMPLNRNQVVPPHNMADIIRKMWNGYYEVNTEVVRETMRVVTPRITDFKNVGQYIENECKKYPTYMLEKYVGGVYKRSIKDNISFSEFAGKNIMELNIINLDEVKNYEAKQP